MSKNILSIEELQVDPKKTLTSDTKKALVKIVEDEFQNQASTQDHKLRELKNQVIEKYKKEVKFTALRNAVLDLQDKLKRAQNDLAVTGLNIEGEISSSYSSDPLVKEGSQKIHKLLDAIDITEGTPRNLKNKIISRLWMASTIGEATVILRGVLGNGIIPSLTSNDIKMIEE